MSQRKYTLDQEPLIINDYLEGLTLYQAAAKYGGSFRSIANVLERNNIPRRKGGVQSGLLNTSLQNQEIINRYNSGQTLEYLAKEYHTQENKIKKILTDAGIEIRFLGGLHRRLFDGEDLIKLGDEYKSGLSLAKLAMKYNTNPITIRNSLLRINIQTRESARPIFWTQERINQTIEMYKNGLSQQEIANKWNINQTAVGKKLRQAGVISRGSVLRGELNNNWKGGKHIKEGYVQILVEEKDAEFGSLGHYMPEHRLVMARYLGRKLRNDETVHHIDTNPENNDILNLQLRIGNHGTAGALECADCGSFNIVPVELKGPSEIAN